MAITSDQIKALVSIPTGTLSDDEVADIGDTHTSTLRAAAAVCRRLSTHYAVNTDIGAGSARVSGSQASRQWLYLARDFETRASEGNAASPRVSGAQAGTAFDQQLFNNYGAGLDIDGDGIKGDTGDA